MTISNGRREELEMAGYSHGREPQNKRLRYHSKAWNSEERAAFDRGYEEGLRYSISIGEATATAHDNLLSPV